MINMKIGSSHGSPGFILIIPYFIFRLKRDNSSVPDAIRHHFLRNQIKSRSLFFYASIRKYNFPQNKNVRVKRGKNVWIVLYAYFFFPFNIIYIYFFLIGLIVRGRKVLNASCKIESAHFIRFTASWHLEALRAHKRGQWW